MLLTGKLWKKDFHKVLLILKNEFMSYQLINNEKAQQFEFDLGNSKAIATYEIKNNKYYINFVGVPPEHRGKGLGAKLMKAALEEIKLREMKVVPICSFAYSYMLRTEYKSMIA